MEEIIRGGKPLVLSVGQCGYDDSRIARILAEVGGGIERSHDAADALRKLAAKKYAFAMINRIFDSDGDSGIAFIAAAQHAGIKIPLMLVSDFPEAQSAAESIGALPGFGKSQLGLPIIPTRLRAALALSQNQSN